MRNGKCPKCGSMNGYTREGGVHYYKPVPFYVHVKANSPMPKVCTIDSYIVLPVVILKITFNHKTTEEISY